MVYNQCKWGANAPFVFEYKMNLTDGILIAKYIAAIAIVFCIVMAPIWLARQNKKDGINMVIVRLAGWTLGWTGIGWLVSLFWGAKK